MKRLFILLEQNQGGAEYDNGDGITRCKTLCLERQEAWDLARQLAVEHLNSRGGVLIEDEEVFHINEALDHGHWEASFTVQEISDFRPADLRFTLEVEPAEMERSGSDLNSDDLEDPEFGDVLLSDEE